MTSAGATRIKVGIVGGTGYTGVELLRLLSQHPNAELTAITSRKEDGMPVADMYPNLRGRVDLKFQTPEKAALEECDVVFFRHASRRRHEPGRIAAEKQCPHHRPGCRLPSARYRHIRTLVQNAAFLSGLFSSNRSMVWSSSIAKKSPAPKSSVIPAAIPLRCCWVWLRCSRAAAS